MNAEMSGHMPSGTGPKNESKEVTSLEFFRRIETFPQEAQDRIASLSSLLLEADIYEKIKRTPLELNGLVNDLSGSGLSREDVDLVFNYFQLPKSQVEDSQKTTNPV